MECLSSEKEEIACSRKLPPIKFRTYFRGTKTCRECPDVFFRADSPRPLVIRACVYIGKIRLARETTGCPASASVLLNTTAEPPDVHPVVSGRGGRVRTGVNGGCGDEGNNNGGSLVLGSAGDGEISSRSSLKHEKMHVEGAHRVWGTLKVTTSSSVRNAVSRLCNSNHLQVKRKTVCNYNWCVTLFK